MICAVCFDFDGTLAEYQGNYSALVAQVAGRLGIEGDLKKLLAQYTLEEHKEGQQNYADALGRALQALGHEVPGDLPHIAQEGIQAYVADMHLLLGALEVLNYFSPLPLAIITNGPSDTQRAAIAKVGIAERFKALVVSGDVDVAVRKPNPRIFQIAAQRLGVPIESCLMIGNNLEADVKGAIAAGMQGVYRPWP